MVFQTSVADDDGDAFSLAPPAKELHGDGEVGAGGEAGEDAFLTDEAAGPMDGLIVWWPRYSRRPSPFKFLAGQ